MFLGLCISMETKHGERPYIYTRNKTRTLSKPVYENRYTLTTGDSFEIGGAYSLHKTRKKAENFKTEKWWFPLHRGVEVFVSSSTLEKLAKNRGQAFRSWEN